MRVHTRCTKARRANPVTDEARRCPAFLLLLLIQYRGFCDSELKESVRAVRGLRIFSVWVESLRWSSWSVCIQLRVVIRDVARYILSLESRPISVYQRMLTSRARVSVSAINYACAFYSCSQILCAILINIKGTGSTPSPVYCCACMQTRFLWVHYHPGLRKLWPFFNLP